MGAGGWAGKVDAVTSWGPRDGVHSISQRSNKGIKLRGCTIYFVVVHFGMMRFIPIHNWLSWVLFKSPKTRDGGMNLNLGTLDL